jgi:hypothetical protein
MLYDRVADLSLRIDGYEFERRERDTSSGFTRTSTVVSFHGDDETGRGEDVTYENEAHDTFVEPAPEFPLTGSYTFGELSDHLGEIDLFPDNEPSQSIFRQYRRWAFESAGLDLALRQAGTDLAARLNREYNPVRFVVSTRLAEPPTGERLFDLLEHSPDLEFKLDPTPAWTGELVDRLATADAVRVLDLKGQYEGTDVDVPADPELYELIVEGVPEAVIEDPALTDETRPVFDGEEGRVSWDYPIRGVADVEDLPWEPSWLNIKPSRFGSVRSLFETIEFCRERNVDLYGGGQFELAVGREQLHALASLFYPDAPNDVAPRVYNEPELGDNLPASPLAPPADPAGLSWR